jgi:SAM-dependent MidA family methyltransferase
MEVALYHPECGYYRSRKDPFGKAGDFFTAEQLQPVFGRLVSRYLQTLANDLGGPGPVTIVELGAGRGEMAGEINTMFVHITLSYQCDLILHNFSLSITLELMNPFKPNSCLTKWKCG